ncbi:hypothetical protein JCM10213_004876 [Rhodosporidiobolus nylandii]
MLPLFSPSAGKVAFHSPPSFRRLLLLLIFLLAAAVTTHITLQSHLGFAHGGSGSMLAHFGGGWSQAMVDSQLVSEVESECEGKHGCRWLVPTMIAGDPSRVHLNLLQLSALAASLNRTLVLPNTDLSRFSTCDSSPFATFFSRAAFAAEVGGSPLPQSTFATWLNTRQAPVQTRAIRISPFDAASPPALHPCLNTSALAKGLRETLYFPETEGGLLAKKLRSLDMKDEVEVLLVAVPELREPLFPGVEQLALTTGKVDRAFAHREEWSSVADRVLDQLADEAVGVWWQTAGVEGRRARTCGASLVQALLSVQEAQPRTRTVNLAADFAVAADAQEGEEGEPDITPAKVVLPLPLAGYSEGDEDDTLFGEVDAAAGEDEDNSELLLPSTPSSSFARSFRSLAGPAGLVLYTFRSLRPSLLTAAPELKAYIEHPLAAQVVDPLVLQQLEYFLAGLPDDQDVEGDKACSSGTDQAGMVQKIARERARTKVGEDDGADGDAEGEADEAGELQQRLRTLRNVVALWAADGAVEESHDLEE